MISPTNNNANNPAINGLNQNNTKVIPLKKAFKIIQFLSTIRHPHWIMAPMIAGCTEYDSRLAWTEESVSKLINLLFYVSLTESTLLEKGFNLFAVNEKDIFTTQAKIERTLTMDASGPVPGRGNSIPNTALSSFNLGGGGGGGHGQGIRGSFPGPAGMMSSFLNVPPISNNNNNQQQLNRRASPRANRPVASSSTPSLLNNTKKGMESSKSFLQVKDSSLTSSGNSSTNAQQQQEPVYSRADLLRKLHPMVDYIWKECSEKHPLSISTSKQSILSANVRNNSNNGSPQRLRPVHHSRPLFFEYLRDLDYYFFTKRDKFYYSMDMNDLLQMKEIQQMYIPINDFLYVLILSWEAEYHAISEALEKAKITNLRRKAITSNFTNIILNSQQNKNNSNNFGFSGAGKGAAVGGSNDVKSILPPMTSGEKHAIVRLLYFYRHQTQTREFLGIDWEEVEKKVNASYYPFSIPRTLLKKSRIELNLLSEYLVKVIEQQQMQDELEAKEFETEQKLLLLPIHFTDPNQTASLLKGNLSDDEQSVMTNRSLTSIIQTNQQKRFTGLIKSSDQSVSQTTVGGSSSNNTFAAKSTTSASLSLLQEMNKHFIPKQYFELLEQAPSNDQEQDSEQQQLQQPPESPAGSQVSAMTFDSLSKSYHRQQKWKSKNSHYESEEESDEEGSDEDDEDDEDNAVSPRTQLIEAIKEDNKAYYNKVDNFRKARIKEIRSKILKRYSDALNKGERVLAEDDVMMETHKKIENTKEFKSQVNPKTDGIKDITTEEIEEIQKGAVPDHHKEYLAFLNDPNVSWKSRIIPFLNLTLSLNKDGDFLGSLSKTYSDASVKYLSMKNGNATLNALDIMVKTYCNKWQLEYMKILQLMGNPRLSSKGAELVGKALQANCKLIHLNLNGMKIGDSGLKYILEGIVEGGGEEHMIRMDLKDNRITIAMNPFRLLGRFVNLRFLDLSKNSFTLDKESQWDSFYHGIFPLIHSKLEYFSLAYNKIQDTGFQRIVHEIILTKDAIYYYIPLKVLDVAHCFITNRSKYEIQLLIVNSMQRENDGSAYRKAFEYTEQNLFNPEYDTADNTTGLINLPTFDGLPLNRRSKYTDQKISKVFFKPEFITILTHLTKAQKKNMGLQTATTATTLSENILRNSFMSNPGDNGGFFDNNSSFRMDFYYPTTPQLPQEPTPTTPKSMAKRKRNLRTSFIGHLNSIVHQSENIIMKLNHVQRETFDLHVANYYILTNLQTILFHGSVITQNVWDEILDYQHRSILHLLYHEDENFGGGIEYAHGIEEISCYELSDYQIELHPVELKQL
jgi:hypothetical protein